MPREAEIPKEGNIDYFCDDCAKIHAGPHAGEVVPSLKGKHGIYKGAHVSGGFCPECALRHVNEHRASKGLPPKERL